MPGSEIRIRAVEWTDLGALASLEQELFADDAWSIETWWAELAGRPRRDYVVAVNGLLDPSEAGAPGSDAAVGDEPGAIVGYGGLDVAGDVADIMTIATAPACQGRGIGRLLLDTLIGRAADHGVEAIMLEVRADNAAAR
ncbi:MAG: GNAT family N-acetyltransferase, partial [Dermatophilaceae bacterium]